MQLYLDTCALNRLFDDQRQTRIRLEAEAVILILEKVHQQEWEWIGSDALDYEIQQTPDLERRQRLALLSETVHQRIGMTEAILQRAEHIATFGFSEYDAVHLASAEHGKVDIFLTTDDNLVTTASRNENLFPFAVKNPVRWLEEVL